MSISSRAAAPLAPRPGILSTLVNTALLWLTTAIAATALWPIYRDVAIIILVAVALAVGSIIAILGAVFRWRSYVVLLVSVAAFLVVGTPVAVPTQARAGVLPTLAGLGDLVAGVALGWKQLLTISLPVGDYQALLVPALVLVLGTVVLGLTIALRARHGEFGAVAPITVFLVATAFGPQHSDYPLVVPVALLVSVLFWLVWMRWYRRRTAIARLAVQSAESGGADIGLSGVRTVISAALILAIASTAAIAAANAAPPSVDRSVLRTSMEQPFDPRDYVSPLSGFRSYWQPAKVDSVLFDISGLPVGGRIRIATMDTYDGVVYSVGSDQMTSASGSFTRVPGSVDQSSTTGEQVSVDVTIAGYSGVWLPTVGTFESIVFTSEHAQRLRDGFYYNDTSGTAAVVSGLSAGDRYSLTAVVPRQPTTAQLSELQPGTADVPDPHRVPDELTARLEQYVNGVDGEGSQLVAMLAGLASDGYISHGIGDEALSRSGHAADRIAQLFSDPRMIGDAEQYSVAAALMAEQIGFPARVVLGFVPSSGQVHGGDVSAWVEVNTAQYGWVTIDPTPAVRDIPEELPEDNAQIARPLTIVPPPVVQNESFDKQSTPDSEQELPPDLDPVLQALLAALRIAGWALLGVAIVLAPFILVIAAKVRRRRLRRHAPDIVRRISGGWREFEDAVVDHGLSPGASATRSEVASIAGGVQSEVLAAIADRAVFSPDDPTALDADRVWRAVDELQRSLEADLTRWQRLRARISLRSLGGYSVRRLFKT